MGVINAHPGGGWGLVMYTLGRVGVSNAHPGEGGG